MQTDPVPRTLGGPPVDVSRYLAKPKTCARSGGSRDKGRGGVWFSITCLPPRAITGSASNGSLVVAGVQARELLFFPYGTCWAGYTTV